MRSDYVIRFETTPNCICFSKRKSSLEHSDFVSSAVCDLLKFDLVSKVLIPSVVNLSLVSVHLEGKSPAASFAISVMLLAVSPKPNSGMKIGRFFSNALAGWLHVQIRIEIGVPPHRHQ